jgi:esterase/lipase
MILYFLEKALSMDLQYTISLPRFEGHNQILEILDIIDNATMVKKLTLELC